MFRGNHPTKIDGSGRLKLPVDHREVVDAQYGSDFFITSLDGKVIEIWPMKEWEQIEAQLAEKDASEEKAAFLEAVNYWGQVVKFDSAGRLLLPQDLREHSGVTGDVAVVGLQRYLQVRSKDEQQAQLVAKPVTLADVARLGIRK
ncbi:MAG: division/cell wall cluster transcriptional repressor MraZ [Acidobacteriota bacterium]